MFDPGGAPGDDLVDLVLVVTATETLGRREANCAKFFCSQTADPWHRCHRIRHVSPYRPGGARIATHHH
jgi:hypothetical protein